MILTLACPSRIPTASIQIATLAKRSSNAPVMIRMDQAMRDKLEVMAQATGTSLSEIVRRAVALELPSLLSGQTNLSPS